MTPANEETLQRIMRGQAIPEHVTDMLHEAELMNSRVNGSGDLPAAVVMLILVTAGVSVRARPQEADPFAQPVDAPAKSEAWRTAKGVSEDGRARFGRGPGGDSDGVVAEYKASDIEN